MNLSSLDVADSELAVRCVADWHQEVMVVDIDEDVINELSDKVTRAVVADVTQKNSQRFGRSEF